MAKRLTLVFNTFRLRLAKHPIRWPFAVLAVRCRSIRLTQHGLSLAYVRWISWDDVDDLLSHLTLRKPIHQAQD